MTVHEFRADLAFSEEPASDEFWQQVYFCAFPNFVKRIPVTGNTDAQRRGVDCLIYLANDRILRVDEKLRREAYRDILLEHTSNTRTKAPGWIEKDLNVDLIAYGMLPTQKAYLLDWLLLQRAWRANKAAWKAQYKDAPALNEGYQTLCTPVPIGVLFAALNRAFIVELEAAP